mgnify:CR=1 FL=1
MLRSSETVLLTAVEQIFTSVDLSGIVELGENAFKECSFEELVSQNH